MRIRKFVTALTVLAAAGGIMVATSTTATADGGVTPSNWHCC